MRLKITGVRGNGSANDLILSYNAHEESFTKNNEAVFRKIEEAISKTDSEGKMPLWEGYNDIQNYARSTGPNSKRSMSQVRTGRGICEFYAWLVTQKKPETVLEFGAAFGASGMYWLAGLGIANTGRLISFEPNTAWCKVARKNFELINNQFLLTAGTFEENLSLVSPLANITLIDAIHTKSVVLAQFELVKKVSQPGAIVIFDDLSFSDDMWSCWQEVCNSADISSAWQIGERVGIVELR